MWVVVSDGDEIMAGSGWSWIVAQFSNVLLVCKNESLLKKIITEIYQQKESISKGWIS